MLAALFAARVGTYPVHFALVFKTSITFAKRRFFVSSCFAPEIELAISFLCVNANFSHRSCAFLLFANSRLSSAGASTVRVSSSRSITTSTISPGCTPAP